MSESPQERAPLGALAEPEVPHHDDTDLDQPAGSDVALEESSAYALAVEDGLALPAGPEDPGAGDSAPLFQEPGEA